MAKPKKRKTTVNPEAVKREVKKLAKSMAKNTPDAQGNIELDAGTVRRESSTEQDMGTSKYHNMIHDHNSKNKHILDRLPFTFPKKRKIRSHLSVLVECVECGHEHYGSENTIGFVCPVCKAYRKVRNPEAEARGQDSDITVGIFGTATDKLRLLEERDKKKNVK